MEPAAHVPIERLLEHRAWVTRLARALVADDARADDVAQDAWLAALRHPPRHDAGLKTWLARLVRHRASNALRAETRRGAHENVVPPPPGPRAPDDAVAHIEETERVARAVLALEDPYRTVIALRFYEDLDARAIAARTGDPVETVRTRIKRALARLRERLDEEHGGDGRAWCAALLPLAAGAARTKASLVSGGIAVTTKTKLALPAAVLLALALAGGVAAFVLRSGGGDADRATGTDTAAAPAPPRRPARSGTTPAADVLPAAPAGSASVLGSVRFAETRKPAIAQRVVLSTPGAAPVETQTDERGRFRFDRLATLRPWRVAVDGAGCAPVVVANLRLEADEARDVGVLWLDTPAKLDVVVKDWGDRPVAGAAVELQRDFERGTSFDSWTIAAVLRHVAEPLAATTTDASGRAAFALPPGLRVIAVVRAAGFALTWRQGLAPTRDGFGGDVLIRLDAGDRVEGRVLHADRTPASGIVVFASSGGDSYGAALVPHATTGADGRFAVENVARGDIRLRAGTPGLPPAEAALVRVPAGAPVEIVLDGKVVEGRVTSADDGAPLCGARVRLNLFARDRRASWVAEAVTGEDGRYHADTMRDGGLFTIRVERPGYAVLTDSPAGGLEFRDGRASRDFALRRGARVAGIVTGPGGPVAGARIAANWSCGPGGLARVDGFTGDDGRFSLEGVAPGTVVVQATSDAGFQAGLSAYWIGELFQNRKPAGAVDVPAEGLADVAIALVAGVPVSGRVETTEGAAVGGAFVQSGWTSVRSAEDGSFRIAVEPRADGAWISAVQGGRSSEQVRVATEGPAEGVVLRLVPPIRFVGRVTAEGGAVPEAASVEVVLIPLRRQRYGSDDVQWARVPVVDGKYAAEVQRSVASEGRLVVRASAPGFGTADSAPIVLAPDRSEYANDLVLGPARALEGRVVSSADRSAVAGARVAILPRNWVPDPNDDMPRALGAVTGADGRFRMADAPDGDMKVEVSHDAFVRTVFPVRQPADGLVLEVEPALAIAGTVRLAGGGAVAKASVTLHREGDTRMETWRATSTDQDGRFRIGGLASGTYVVTVTQPWDGGASARPWEKTGVAAGTKDLDVAMDAAQQIAGRVLDPSGKPVAECSVQAFSETGERYTPSDATKDDGAFTVRGLGAGTYALVARPRGVARLLPCRVTGIASGAAGVEIRLTAGETIRGRLVDAAGAAVGAALIRADDLQATDPWTRGETVMAYTEPSGAFALEGLPAGRYRLVHVVDANAVGGVRPLRGGEDVASGAADVRLVAGGVATISGTVLDEEGRPVEGARVSAAPVGGGPRCGARTDAKGAFVIANASDLVRYSLRASANDRVPGMADDVAPGASGVVLRIARGLEASGRVLQKDGTPFAKRYVQLTLEGSDYSVSAATDADGRFTAAALKEGAYRVEEVLTEIRYGQRSTPRACGTIRAGEKDAELRMSE